ncbi:splicing factor 1 [Rhinatrema bivittatum]|uniref:splicing factor 1 n=1 Tax=Rhinatrema bivittatum TaxID=194408 RepID=UPI00112B05ED|nr:splicing factor 1 [Rhinatrema bivittatum]
MATGANATPLDFSRKRKRSRWNNETCDQKTIIPGMPTVIPPGLSRDQERAYIVQLQIEDLTRKLRTGDLGIPPNPEDRSPSPEPIYNSEGKRLNTREFRTRKKLEEERHNLITEMVGLNPDFKPPADYKPPATRVSDKVMIPQDEYPEINFVGLLIGPRGNTLKNIEKECNAKIMIRGKGSVKEGKVGRKDGQMLPGEDEPLHALVTANTMENVKKAVEQIRNILKQGIETPEDQNDLRKMQLRELARLNGTLREDDNRILRPWQNTETRSITNNTLCSKCGGAGHIASDCKFARPGEPQSAQDKARMDKEYLSLMAELGEAPVPISIGSSSGPSSSALQGGPRPSSGPGSNQLPPNRPPWMNSGPSDNRPYHGMHGGGPNGPGGPHNFPHAMPSMGGHHISHNPSGPPLPWMQPPPPPMNQGPHHPGPLPMVPGPHPCGLWGESPAGSKKYDASTSYGNDATTSATTQWSATTSSLRTSTTVATAAASTSTPTSQQQYGLQCTNTMAEYSHYHWWYSIHSTLATTTRSNSSLNCSPSNAGQPIHGASTLRGATSIASRSSPSSSSTTSRLSKYDVCTTPSSTAHGPFQLCHHDGHGSTRHATIWNASCTTTSPTSELKQSDLETKSLYHGVRNGCLAHLGIEY